MSKLKEDFFWIVVFSIWVLFLRYQSIRCSPLPVSLSCLEDFISAFLYLYLLNCIFINRYIDVSLFIIRKVGNPWNLTFGMVLMHNRIRKGNFMRLMHLMFLWYLLTSVYAMRLVWDFFLKISLFYLFQQSHKL